VEAREIPSSPHGRALCRTCGAEVPQGHRAVCSDACVDDRAAARSPSHLRQRVFQRDHGICAQCGIDTAVLGVVLHVEWQRVKLARTPQERRDRAEFRQRFRWFFRRRSFWDADHLVPIVEGGENTMANMRTLCVPCHQRVTKDQARDRASRRRRQERHPAQAGWR
jgi:5-methylcytosine-specific restriction protein A